MPEPPSISKDSILYIVGTPIGNLADITLRAIQTLSDVDWIAAEDTRHTTKLLKHHGIRTPLISYHDHNEARRAPKLLTRLAAGQKGALVTDAGTPGISDPGYRLVNLAANNGIKVVPIPGASAAIAALSASGLPTDSFAFEGFLPKKKAARQTLLKRLCNNPGTLILYESPRRIVDLLWELHDQLGNRRVVIGREMTKRHEEFIRGDLASVADQLASRDKIRGEFTVLVTGHRTNDHAVDRESLEKELTQALRANKAPLTAIAKALSKKYALPKSEIYKQAIEFKNNLSIELNRNLMKPEGD